MLERADSAALWRQIYDRSVEHAPEISAAVAFVAEHRTTWGTEMQSGCILRISTTMLLELDNNVTMDAYHDIEDSASSVLK